MKCILRLSAVAALAVLLGTGDSALAQRGVPFRPVTPVRPPPHLEMPYSRSMPGWRGPGLGEIEILPGGRGTLYEPGWRNNIDPIPGRPFGSGPVQRAVRSPEGPESSSPRNPPPGLRPLIPEGAAESWRPPPRESAREGMEPFTEASRQSSSFRTKLDAGLQKERSAFHAHSAAVAHQVHLVHQQLAHGGIQFQEDDREVPFEP